MNKSNHSINVETAQQVMGLAAAFMILFGAFAALTGQTAQASMCFGISLYCVFACYNPQLLLNKLHQLEAGSVSLEEKKFLVASLALMLLAVGWEIFFLPL